jgi:guanine deaminase
VAFPWAQDYLAIYDRYALTGAKTVLAHNVHGTDAELHRLAATHTSVAHCPSSNAALGSGLFPMARHLKAGVRVALGTDVGAGTGFGMLKEALQAYLLQRVRTDGTPLTPAHLLYLATRAGADALGLDGIAGDFRPGTSADLVRVRPLPDSPLGLALARADSMSQVLAAIITLGDAASIDDVWAGGVSVHPAHTTEPPAVQRRA